MVVPRPAFRDDHLLSNDPGVLRRRHLQREDGDAEVCPLRRHRPLPQCLVAGQLLDSSTDRPAALHEQTAPAGQHGARALWGSDSQCCLLHHV